jgi:hypothetical protein
MAAYLLKGYHSYDSRTYASFKRPSPCFYQRSGRSHTYYAPYVPADCVSSQNTWEVPIALDRLRQEGAAVTTTESLAFQLIGSAAHPKFKLFSQFFKEQKGGLPRQEVLILGRDPPIKEQR